MNLGNVIKELRENRMNLKAEYVAKQIDICVKQLYNIEHNNSDISIKKLQKLARLFNMKVSDIILYWENNTPHKL